MTPRRTAALGTALLVAVALGTGAFVTGSAQATGSAGLSTTILAMSTLGPLNIDARTKPADLWGIHLSSHGNTDGYVVDNVLAVGGTTGWHSHPGPSLVFVVRGAVTNYVSTDPACAGTVYSAGSSFVDAGGRDVHMLKNNGDMEAETIAVQFVPQGAARRIDATDVPKNCTGVQ